MTRSWRWLSLRFPEHSSWHLLPEDGDAVGIQLRSMYGFRTATANWPRDWKKTLSEVGYAVGQATSALLHDEAELSRRSVHGDDLLLESARPAGTDTALKVFNARVPPFGIGTLAESNRVSAKIKTGSATSRLNPTPRILIWFCATWSSMESETKSLCSYGFTLDNKELRLRSREPQINRLETTM